MQTALADNRVWQDVSLDHDVDITHVSFSDNGQMLLFAHQAYSATVYTGELSLDGVAPKWTAIRHFNNHLGWQEINDDSVNLAVNPHTSKVLSIKGSKDGDRPIVMIKTRTSKNSHAGNIINMVYQYDPNTWTFTRLSAKNIFPVTLNAGAVKMGIEKAGFWSWDGLPDYLIKDSVTGQWQKTSYETPEPYCRSLVSQLKDRILLTCNGASSDFYESTDSGKTWGMLGNIKTFDKLLSRVRSSILQAAQRMLLPYF